MNRNAYSCWMLALSMAACAARAEQIYAKPGHVSNVSFPRGKRSLQFSLFTPRWRSSTRRV